MFSRLSFNTIDENLLQVYVCVGFGVEDNVKKCCSGEQDDMGLLTYAGLSLDKVVQSMKFTHVSGCSMLRFYGSMVLR